MDALTRRRPRPPATRKEARANQRWRVLGAMAHLVGVEGYAQTSIARVIERAGVSRKAFYEHFSDKEDCFLAAYEELSARLVRVLIEEGTVEARQHRTRAQLRLYLEVLARDLPLARAFMVEVLAAGPRALALREEVNRRFAELVFGHTARDPIVRKAIIGGVNDVVTGALMSGSKDLLALLPQLIKFAARA
jgi:AcrR family transcriptional regulator